jgi:small GTP-binding protein
MSYKYIFKMILLGQPGVGKTSLMARVTQSRNTPCYQPTVGIDFGSTTTHIFDGPSIKTQIWDTAGQEYFAPIVRNYYRDIAVAVFVYDVSDYESYLGVKYWMAELKASNHESCKWVMVGNKIDKFPRKVKEETAKEFAKNNGMDYYEISVRKNENVTCFFYDVVNSFYETIDEAVNVLPPGVKRGNKPRNLDLKKPPPVTQCCLIL